MKLPTLSLNFFKKPAKKKRIITTLGKRSSSASSTTAATASRKPNRRSSSSSNLKSRKRSITYYAPSKSKFYPREHFPSVQRLVRQKTSVVPNAPPGPQLHPRETQLTVSTDIGAKLNNENLGIQMANGTLHSYTAKHTYLCDNEYGDIVLHQPPAWHRLTKPQSPPQPLTSMCYQIDRNIVSMNNGSNNHGIQNKIHTNVASIDSDANWLHDDNVHTSIYAKECTAQNEFIINDSSIKYHTANNIGTEMCKQQTQHHLLPSNIKSAYNTNNIVLSSINSANVKYSKSSGIIPNDNNNKFYSVIQPNIHQSAPTNVHGVGLPIYGASVPSKKKSDRRRRKVRHLIKRLQTQ